MIWTPHCACECGALVLFNAPQELRQNKSLPSSHQTYRGYMDNHIGPNIGDIPLEKLTALDLQKFYKKLLTKGRVDRLEARGQPKGLNAKTVRNIHQILSYALKLAQEQRIILTNPAGGCALPKVEHREMNTLPVEHSNPSCGKPGRAAYLSSTTWSWPPD